MASSPGSAIEYDSSLGTTLRVFPQFLPPLLQILKVVLVIVSAEKYRLSVRSFLNDVVRAIWNKYSCLPWQG